LGKTIAEALLAVHRSYYPILKPFIDKRIIKGLAHITGGGIPGNLKRIIPGGMSAIVKKRRGKSPLSSIFFSRKGGLMKTRCTGLSIWELA